MQIYLRDVLRFLKSSIWFFVLIILYRIILDTLFAEVIIPIYGNVYKYSNNSTTETLILSWAILLFFVVLTRSYYYAENGISNTVVFLLFLIQIVPFTTMIGTGNFNNTYIFANVIYFLMLYVMVTIFRKRKNGVRIKFVEYVSPTKKIGFLSILLVVIALYVCGKYSKFNINFNVELVYDLRTAARTYNLPTILTYLFGWACWINPIIIGLCIRDKKYVKCTFLSIVQIFMYGYDGMKAPFFFFMLVVVINLFLPKIKVSTLNSGTLYGLTGATVFCYLSYTITGSYLLSQLFVNRLGMITNQISYAYYNYFTTHQPDFFRGSFLRFFGLKSPYENIPHMISQWFFGFDQGANGGLIADAVTNMGYLGIIVMPTIIAFILVVIDSYTQNIDSRIVICVAIYMTIMLMSMFLFPIFLTGGLIIIFPLLSWINQKDQKL